MSHIYSAILLSTGLVFMSVACSSSNTGNQPDGGCVSLTVKAEAAPNPASIGEYVKLTATPDCGSGNYNYEWTFGDGTPNATAQNPHHQYWTAGNFEARVGLVDVGTQERANGIVYVQVKSDTTDGGGGNNKPDLKVQNGNSGITLQDPPPNNRYIIGDQIKIRFVVENSGDGAASGFQVDTFLKRNIPPYTETLLNTQNISSLGANTTQPVQVNMAVPAVDNGPYVIVVRLDTQSAVEETTELNNEATYQTGLEISLTAPDGGP